MKPRVRRTEVIQKDQIKESIPHPVSKHIFTYATTCIGKLEIGSALPKATIGKFGNQRAVIANHYYQVDQEVSLYP
jgi:hypothetical protein